MGFTFLSCLCPSALEIEIETIDSTRGILLYSLSRFLLLATCPSETENFKFFKSNNLKCSYSYITNKTKKPNSFHVFFYSKVLPLLGK